MQAEVTPRVLPYDPFEDETIVAENLSFEDFLKRFDGQHAEWHQGRVILVVGSSDRHQIILSVLDFILRLYLSFRPVGKYRIAPFTMRTTGNLPKREPDLVFVLNEHADRITNTFLNGAADLAVEIVSSESVKRDYGNKFEEYELAGVREYWLLDPLRKIVHVYILGSDNVYHPGSLDDKGRLTSTLLPDFAIDHALFWREDEPMGQELAEFVQKMLKEQ
jgi:Uma2 family endonuclease